MSLISGQGSTSLMELPFSTISFVTIEPETMRITILVSSTFSMHSCRGSAGLKQ